MPTQCIIPRWHIMLTVKSYRKLRCGPCSLRHHRSHRHERLNESCWFKFMILNEKLLRLILVLVLIS